MADPVIVGKRTSTLNGQSVTMALYSDGSRRVDPSLTGGVPGRIGGTARVPYQPEAKQTWTPQQFGLNKYYSPTFGFSLDWNPNQLNVAQRKAQGINLFNAWALTDAEKATLSPGDGMVYLTESGIHGPYEGARYFEASLAEYEDYLYNHIPAFGYGPDQGMKLAVFNLESSNSWNKGNYGGSSHWPSWDSKKYTSVVCESDGVTRTLEQIDQQGLFPIEDAVRRGNRRRVAHQALRMKASGPIKTSDGSSMYQGLPRMDFAGLNNVFLNSYCDVSKIGGSNNTITLNGRTYTNMTGSHWGAEDIMWGYYYLFDYNLYQQDYLDIFVNKVAGKTNLPYLWSKIALRHIVADEKGYIQLNRRLMNINQGTTRPIYRMIEPMYEGRGSVIETGQEIDRLTWDELQPGVTGDTEAPKVWQPPYYNYSRYIVIRMFAGNEPGWGFHTFPLSPAHIRSEGTLGLYNFHWHSLQAINQARNDMQPYERWFTGSTLVEDPEVQVGGSGSFVAYSGTEAYNYSDGVTGVQRPAYILRYKPTPTGWRVLIVGGMNQGFTSERIDIVRVPGGLLNGNQFRVKLRGPAAHVYEFAVRNSDSNQIYEALPQANPDFEKPGYAGRTKSS